jgi:predicted nucleic acid-binding protein
MDNCCFNRPFDDLSNDRVRLESEAVLTIIDHCERDVWNLCNSDVLTDEIYRMDDTVKKEKVLTLYSRATVGVEINSSIISRASKLMQANIKPFDALHVASAEAVGADIFLTTDRRLINASKRIKTSVKVTNPAVWLMEVLYND